MEYRTSVKALMQLNFREFARIQNDSQCEHFEQLPRFGLARRKVNIQIFAPKSITAPKC